MPRYIATIMSKPAPLTVLLAALTAMAALPPIAHAAPFGGPGEAQGEARREVRAGNVRSLREIERHVLPMLGGAQYLGPEYDPLAVVYRLKFIKDGHVVFVDVDARSGEIIGQRR
jgi:hypothetical protein